MALGALLAGAGIAQQLIGSPSQAVEANALYNEARIAKKSIETANRNAENLISDMGTKASQQAATAMGRNASAINF
ncbi:hypothetical protein [Pseudomonas yamanorum]|uniref:hypothetical protein n=1 Tax=Pseudomonas yamanorum TaxID=515393 RepID=UPI000B853C36|nr:hypothetical protein [Pseudomonas yamanorum]